ncbi:DUF1254 domain-containing protein [Methyloligella sp. 2.7D]|uniref:DUF1254 domain-containing protein n=1 Tax=unclassified Methyloligella TaxID=2625955 RepID=UPI00157D0EB4|nr:DUF1254 domain-containing protein [Methyloligella sp. GL2]QKP78675.1 DUF1254 domain-containing protein [Methyloligella sp. GL2]
MKRLISALGVVAVLAGFSGPSAAETPAITKEEAHEIGVNAYLYFYPLITMDLTRLQSLNLPPDEGLSGPPNKFFNLPAFPPADMRQVVRPNFDTLYSSAWLDLTDGPVVVSVPDTDGRYYLLPMLDMWTDVIASPGWRTTGTKAGTFLITPPDWRPELKDGFAKELGLPEGTQRISASTPWLWVIGRTKTDGPSDYPAVHKIQAGYKITPLANWGKDVPAPDYKRDPSFNVKTPPKLQIDSMAADKYFAYAAELLKTNPPHFTDRPIIARMKRLGIVPGESFDLSKAPEAVQAGLKDAPKDAQALMAWKFPTVARNANNWSMNTDTVGVYGNYYLKRAIMTQQGLGANVPEDAVYPLSLGDKDGKPLDGNKNYRIHFAKGELPPVQGFWSVTLYDDQGFQVPNSLNRFALSSWMDMKTNPDGSLDLLIQNQKPDGDMKANWLPAPKGPFTLTMRLYAPDSAVLTGKWNPPAIAPVE